MHQHYAFLSVYVLCFYDLHSSMLGQHNAARWVMRKAVISRWHESVVIVFRVHASRRVHKTSQVFVWGVFFRPYPGPHSHLVLEVMEFLKRLSPTGLFNNIWSNGIILTPYTFHSQVYPLDQSWVESWRERERQKKKWSDTGEVEASINNLKWIQSGFERILPVSSSASLSHSRCVQQCGLERRHTSTSDRL